jgi:hypothetical protein
MAKKQDLRALASMIMEATTLIETSPELPQGRTARAKEILGDALQLAKHLAEVQPAAVLGQKGGKVTAKRGSEYFRQLASKRKKHSGGRPKNNL